MKDYENIIQLLFHEYNWSSRDLDEGEHHIKDVINATKEVLNQPTRINEGSITTDNTKVNEALKKEIEELKQGNVSDEEVFYNNVIQRINNIMRESLMIKGRSFGKREGNKIMSVIEEWASN